DGSVSAWHVSTGASTIGAPTPRAVSVECPRGIDRSALTSDFVSPGDHAGCGSADSEWWRRDISHAARSPGAAGPNDRFQRASQVTSYLGLVPQEYSSGERQRRGRLLRSAHPQLQSLLVQAAWRMSRSADPRTATLRAWAEAIARRRGKKIAMVALARRLARIL